MIQEKLILVGAGGHSVACIDVIEQERRFIVAGLVGLDHEVSSSHFGYQILGSDSSLDSLVNLYPFALISLGQMVSAENRIRLYSQVLDAGFTLVTVIAPSAYVSPRAVIGPGTIVMHGAIINAGVKVGSNCIINSNSLLEHGVQIGDHCHISTGVILNGESSVGSGSFIGSGSIVKQGVSIGVNTVVGMGSVVRHDIKDGLKFLGNSK